MASSSSIAPNHTMKRQLLYRSLLQQPVVSKQCKRWLTSGTYRAPNPFNEPNLHYAPGSPERQKIKQHLDQLRARLPLKVPSTQGKSSGRNLASTKLPSEHETKFSEYEEASAFDVESAISRALATKTEWQSTNFQDRASIFLRAADLISGKYRYDLVATTMLGQGKNPWQAEIDAAAELADFFRFNVGFAQEIYDKQPTATAEGHHGRTDWRPLEGFVYAVSPFNFTAIGGNLISAPALLGNVVIWKPAPMTAYQSYLIHKILLEAGLPEGVIELVNGDAETVTNTVFNHRDFSALAFIGSSNVFRSLWAKAAVGVAEKKYREFPRMVGETSGKNFHLLHPSADVSNAVKQTIRASFEYAGQKCSACSRIYIPESRTTEFFSQMKDELKRITTGPPEDLSAFTGPVIDQKAFDRITKVIDAANRDPELELIYGGTYDGTKGYFVCPTLYRAVNPNHNLLNQELFAPILTAYVYPDDQFSETLTQINNQGNNFALTGNIFSQDQRAIREAEDKLRYAAGNFYINCKITAAVIGQQSFGGARGSGTCDKAGSVGFMLRFTAPRTIKEDFGKLDEVLYPSNLHGTE